MRTHDRRRGIAAGNVDGRACASKSRNSASRHTCRCCWCRGRPRRPRLRPHPPPEHPLRSPARSSGRSSRSPPVTLAAKGSVGVHQRPSHAPGRPFTHRLVDLLGVSRTLTHKKPPVERARPRGGSPPAGSGRGGGSMSSTVSRSPSARPISGSQSGSGTRRDVGFGSVGSSASSSRPASRASPSGKAAPGTASRAGSTAALSPAACWHVFMCWGTHAGVHACSDGVKYEHWMSTVLNSG
eukprot:364979-Chlamydomonas_euryale.AAC.5